MMDMTPEGLTPEGLREAKHRVEAYLARTGVSAIADPLDRSQRFLWTDAFAVLCCFGLYQALDRPCFREKALMLIQAVHDVLGRHREDDPRQGWISGLREEEGRLHPTAGGLRIGKPLPEKPEPPQPGLPFLKNRIPPGKSSQKVRLAPENEDPLDWERDGQYFHYLIRWVHALMKAVTETQGNGYLHMATELMEATRNFIGHNGIYWKMNIELTRPAVNGTSAHDPLDGLVSVEALRRLQGKENENLLSLKQAFDQQCRGKRWVSSDALGIGGLLLNLGRVMDMANAVEQPEVLPEAIRPEVLYRDTMQSLTIFLDHFDKCAPASQRLAFRECGLSLGLRVFLAKVGKNKGFSSQDRELFRDLSELAEHMEEFWRLPESQKAPTWTDHEDINAIMLSSSLIAKTCPDVFL